jgi:alpha-ribazole phosphatase
MKTIFLIRHTTPMVPDGVCYGLTDLPVAETFSREVNIIRDKLNAFLPEAVFSSPLQRCSLLADALFPGRSIKYNDQLVELNFGHWEMSKWNDIDQSLLKDWGNRFWDFSPPAGESFAQLHQRVISVWNQGIIANGCRNIAIVSHSGVMRAILMHLLHIPHSKIFNLNLSYGAVIKVSYTDETIHQVQFL